MAEELGPADDAAAGAESPRPGRATRTDGVVLSDGTTLLDYEILPAPNPLQAAAAATLTLVVSNGTHALVTCTGITLTLAVGTSAKDLVASAEGITSQAPAGWSVAQSAGTFALTPQTPAAGQIGAAGLSFVFAGLGVNGQVGTTAVTVDETASSASQPLADRTGTIALPKFPPQFTLGDLTAHPLEVNAGDAVTLNWSGSPATYRLEFNPGSGSQSVPVESAGPYVAQDLERYPEVVFTLVVSYPVPGQDQPVVAQKQASVQVDAAPPAVTSFGGSVADGGVTLHWTSRNADSCSLNALPQLLKPAGSAGPLSLDRVRYTLVANSSRAGVASAPWNVDLKLAAARSRALLPNPQIYGQWLGAGAESTLVAVLTTAWSPTTASVCVLDRASLDFRYGTVDFWAVGPAMALSRDGTRFFAATKHRKDSSAWLSLVSIPSQALAEVPSPYSQPLGAAFSPDGTTLYLATGGPFGVHVLNAALAEERFIATPDVGPCAVSDDGSLLYVAGYDSLAIVDTATGEVRGQASLESGTSGAIAVDAARDRAYVTRPDRGSVVAVDLSDMKVLAEIVVSPQAGSLFLGLGPSEVYAASGAAGGIVVIDADALQAFRTVPLPQGAYPSGLAVVQTPALELYLLTGTSDYVQTLSVYQVTE